MAWRLKDIKNNLFRHASNLPGWRTDRKILVIESDDWGSIRMSSKESYHSLINKGIPVDKSVYCKNDALECNDDLECLYEVLHSFTDCNGNHPAFTAMVIVANPDFEKIRESRFSSYHYESVTETLKKYRSHDRVVQLWRDGVKQKLLWPEFHGREHLQVHRWIADLQKPVEATRIAFDYGVSGIGGDIVPEIGKSYQAAFDIDHEAELEYLVDVLNEGLELFESIFGRTASFFVPTNGPFNNKLESVLLRRGVCYINTAKNQLEPLGNGKYKHNYRSLGMKNALGQIYLTRNCAFEPSFSSADWVDRCLAEIHSAFLWKKPAIISSHRVNYAGYLQESNRDGGLKSLSHLLRAVCRKWPNVEFMTSTQLGELIKGRS